MRVKTQWLSIISDLQDKGEREAATYFDWLEVIGFTGNTLELAATEDIYKIMTRTPKASVGPGTFRRVGQVPEIVELFWHQWLNVVGYKWRELKCLRFRGTHK